MEELIQKILSTKSAEEVKELNLDRQQGLTKLEDLKQFTNLEHLSLVDIGLLNLKNFPRLHNLKILDLSSNSINGALFLLYVVPNLTHLNLSNNKINHPSQIFYVSKLKKLEILSLANNEVTSIPHYRQKVFKVIPTLQVLDGVNKSPQDEEPYPEEEDMDLEIQKPKKRKLKSGSPGAPPSKRAKSEPKNPLMALNEYKCGLKYNIESVTGPSHSPGFMVSVEVDNQKFTGRGSSKQKAKYDAAIKALAVIKGIGPDYWEIVKMETDFTADNDENGVNFKKFGSESVEAVKIAKKVLKENEKSPLMLLHEIAPGVEFKLTSDKGEKVTQRFSYEITVKGKLYEGCGGSKKLAKQAAARAALANVYDISFNMFPSLIGENEVTADLECFKFPQPVADRIAKEILAKFEEVMQGKGDQAKWKVIAGIAMTTQEDLDDVKVVAITTGTKCINGEHISMIGATLNDCHAEVLARRCLKDFLYKNLEMHLEGEAGQSVFLKREAGGFQLKPGVKFHLYISTAPCGDARIFCPHEEAIVGDKHPNRNSRGVLRTKIESGEGTIPVKSGQTVQTWDSILPGQERLLTMSCSDKVAQWNVIGAQGALLAHFIEPVYLESVILGGLFHGEHMRRALFARFEQGLGPLPALYRLNKPKMRPITSRETRHLTKSPTLSVNWTVGSPRPEVVNAVTGKTDGNQVSRLSKRSFFQRFMNIFDRLPHIQRTAPPRPALYSTFKGCMADYQSAKRAHAKAFLDAKLGSWVKKPVEQNDFELVF